MTPGDHIAEAVGWRRHLHANPELSFEEHATSEFVASRLTEWGLRVRRGYAGTGVVGTLSRGTSRRSIALRADMDALPITEATGLPHASRTPGVMHACGHDGHVAMLLAAARACTAMEGLDGTVHFVFQPAEEVVGGAGRMIEDGLFREHPTDAIYAVHNWPGLPAGSFVARDGAMMAAVGRFDLTVTGRGSHGAMPHEGADPIVAACATVAALNTIAGRNVSPLHSAVVSATRIQAGDAYNVIPDACQVTGTTRWFDEETGATLARRLAEVCRAVPAGYGCEGSLKYEARYPATVNHPPQAAAARRAAGSAETGLTVIDAQPSMAAEDFAVMLRERPGAYCWIGAGRSGDNPGLHSPRFDFNDDVLPSGAAFFTSLVRQEIGGDRH